MKKLRTRDSSGLPKATEWGRGSDASHREDGQEGSLPGRHGGWQGRGTTKVPNNSSASPLAGLSSRKPGQVPARVEEKDDGGASSQVPPSPHPARPAAPHPHAHISKLGSSRGKCSTPATGEMILLSVQLPDVSTPSQKPARGGGGGDDR